MGPCVTFILRTSQWQPQRDWARDKDFAGINVFGDVAAKELHTEPQIFSYDCSSCRGRDHPAPPWPDQEWWEYVPLLGNVLIAPCCTTFPTWAEENKSNLQGCKAFSTPKNGPPKVREGLSVGDCSASFKLLRAEPLTLP